MVTDEEDAAVMNAAGLASLKHTIQQSRELTAGWCQTTRANGTIRSILPHHSLTNGIQLPDLLNRKPFFLIKASMHSVTVALISK